MAVVKANGYGHGLDEVVETLSRERKGVDVFAVASLGEAIQLRSTEKKTPVLLLSAALPEEYQAIARHGFIPTISSLQEATLFAKAARKNSRPNIHFKIDTGMGRLGALPSEAGGILKKIGSLPLTLHSISTHLSSADSNQAYTARQLQTFEKLIAELHEQFPEVPVHVLNSAATILLPSHARDFVRVGLLLYGVSPVANIQDQLKPVLSWKASVTLIRNLPKGHHVSYGGTYTTPHEMKTAVIPAGYADGYPRQLSGKGASVLLHGKRCPVLGRITMDQIIVDISHLGRVRIGDEAVLLGRQHGEEITATEIAQKADTIPWHLFCGITARVAYDHKW